MGEMSLLDRILLAPGCVVAEMRLNPAQQSLHPTPPKICSPVDLCVGTCDLVTEGATGTPTLHRAHPGAPGPPKPCTGFCCPSFGVMEQNHHVLLPQITQHRRLPQGWALPRLAAQREGKEGRAQPCAFVLPLEKVDSCLPLQLPGYPSSILMERDKLSPGLSREGAGGDLGRGTAAGRGAGRGTAPAAPAVLPRHGASPRHRAWGRHPADPTAPPGLARAPPGCESFITAPKSGRGGITHTRA